MSAPSGAFISRSGDRTPWFNSRAGTRYVQQDTRFTNQMTIDSNTRIHTNDASVQVSQNHHQQPLQRGARRALRVAASSLFAGLLAFYGGLGIGLAEDFIRGGKLSDQIVRGVK